MFEAIRKSISKLFYDWRSIGSLIPLFPGYGGAQMSSFEVMNDAYLSNPYVNACANRIAYACAGLPLYVQTIRSGKPSRSENARDLEPLNLLEHPNRYQSKNEFLYELFISLVLDHNAYIYMARPINRPTEGRPVELHVLQYENVQVDENRDPNTSRVRPILGYRYGTDYYTPEQIIHIRVPNPVSKTRGVSNLQAARFAIRSNNESMLWNYSLLRNSCKFSHIFSTDQELNENQLNQAEASIRQYAGSNNAGTAVIFNKGITPVRDGFSPADMDWLNGENLTAQQICIVMGVPPELLGDTANKTYDNAAAARRAFYEDTVLFYAQLFVDKLNSVYVPLFSNTGASIAIDLDAIPALQESQDALYNRMNLANWLTVNEKRLQTGLEPVPGGDVILQPMSNVPLEMLLSPDSNTADSEEEQSRPFDWAY